MIFQKIVTIGIGSQKMEALPYEKSIDSSEHLDGCGEKELWIEVDEEVIEQLHTLGYLTLEQKSALLENDVDEVVFY